MELPRLELVWLRQGGHLRLDPRVRSARLAPRWHDVAQRRSDRPHYWKAETLDSFDGLRWFRSPRNGSTDVSSELPSPFGERDGRSWQLFEYNPRWDEEIEVTVRSLSSDLVLGAGTVYRVDGVEHSISGDGPRASRPSRSRRATATRSMCTRPTRTAGRCASPVPARTDTPRNSLQYTRIYLPAPGDDATEGTGGTGSPSSTAVLGLRQPLDVPLRGEPLTGQSDADQVLRRSRYGDMYRLALDWTAGANTDYDRARSIQTTPPGELLLLRASADSPRAAQRLPLRGQARVLPAVLRNHGAHAANAGDPGACGRGLRAGLLQPDHGRISRAGPRRALVGGGLLHRHRLGAV